MPTPHHFFVDDNIYCDIFDLHCMQQAVAASIEAIYILLGDSDLSVWQDPVSFDKLEEMIIRYSAGILSQTINTQCMDIEMPSECIVDILHVPCKKFGSHWKVFILNNIKSITGKLGHIATTAPWLWFLLPDLYVEIKNV